MPAPPAPSSFSSFNEEKPSYQSQLGWILHSFVELEAFCFFVNRTQVFLYDPLGGLSDIRRVLEFMGVYGFEIYIVNFKEELKEIFWSLLMDYRDAKPHHIEMGVFIIDNERDG